MAVYKQPKSKYQWYKFTWEGELIRKSTKQTNKRVAELMEAAHRTALAKGEVGIRDHRRIPTMREFAPKFIAAIETQCADKPTTVVFYKSKLDTLLNNEHLASSRLNHIEEEAVDAYKQMRSKMSSIRKKPFAVASINRELATLRRLLRLAHEWKIIDRVPRIRLISGERIREFVLSYGQEPVYFATLPTQLHDVALLLVDTGLRIGECLSLEWLDVHFEPASGAKYGYLRVRGRNSKNSKSRTVPLSGRVRDMLRGIGPEKAGYVFHREDGSPLCETWLDQQHAHVRTLLKMSPDFVLHSLRHTFGTRLGESGADAFTIMKLMGHSSVTISQRYVHPSPESVERAFARLEALNMSELQKVGIELGIPIDTILRP